jgi:integrase
MCRICTAVRNAIHGRRQTAKPINPVHPTTLSNEQEQALLATIMKMPNGIDLRDIVIVMLSSGIRRGELERLKWSNIDLNAGALHADHRYVPLSGDVIAVLAERATRVQSDYVMGQHPVIAITKASRGLKLAASSIGLPGLTWHDLRHTFAARCVASGMPVEVLCSLGGWSVASLNTILKRTVVAPAQVKEEWNNAMNALEGTN